MDHSQGATSCRDPRILVRSMKDNVASSIPESRSESGESQEWNESYDESTFSATSDERTPDSSLAVQKHRSSRQRLDPSSPLGSRSYSNDKLEPQGRRNSCGSRSSSSCRSKKRRKQANPVPLASEGSLSSYVSSHPHQSELDRDQQVRLAGEHFSSGQKSISDLNDDSDLEKTSSPQTKASAAILAPFRGFGGIPEIPSIKIQSELSIEVKENSEVLSAEAGSQSSPPSVSSGRSLTFKRLRSLSHYDTLQHRLFEALVSTHEISKEFFPRKVLSAIITRSTVREELYKELSNEHSDQKIEEYVSKICGPKGRTDKDENGAEQPCFIKVFVILVLIAKTTSITKFLELGISDLDLPLEMVKIKDKKGLKELRLRGRTHDPKRPSECVSSKWTQLQIRDFDHYQWTTISPFFARGGHKQVTFYSLHNQDVLPFPAEFSESRNGSSNRLEFEGGFSRVTKVNIHPDHHNLRGYYGTDLKEGFAVKCLHSKDKTQFDKEVDILRRFSDPDVPAHKHLISLLTTYQQFDTYYLVFPWAEADLRRYWRENSPNPQVDQETVMWFVEQCKGLAEGVVAIHQYKSSKKSSTLQPQSENKTFGHHGDIKPENVLWFRDLNYGQAKGGTLKLSDFGLAGVGAHRTRSMQHTSAWATSFSYQAPEVDLEGTGAIGRSYDMWSLGCLYLEFATWLIGGWDFVDHFHFSRIPVDPVEFMLGQDNTTFYILRSMEISPGNWKQTAVIKPSVLEFVNKQLLPHPSCTEFLREFIKMVMDDLLVVNTEDVCQRYRAESQEVVARLRKMLCRCKNEREYGFNGRLMECTRGDSR